MSELSKKNKFILYFFFIFLGLFTISYQINFEDFWLDEMHSFWIADPNLMLNETILRHNKSDYHNPILFNLILKNFLNLFGYNPEVARYLSLIFGFLSFFIFGLITYEIKKDNTFLLTTLLACLSIYIIKYSQEVRPYSLLLLTSALNIYFFLKVTNEKQNNKKNVILFVFFSVINYSTNPFSLIIFFSQIFFSIYKFLLFRKKYIQLYISIILIVIFYLFFNYRYILVQISFENYMLSSDIMNVLDGLYFPRFFGSKIMGYFYLAMLLSLVLKNRRKIFLSNNSYIFFLIIIIFSFLIPFLYGIYKTPVLHDRYIIFILIPIFVLIPCLLNDFQNLKLKKLFISLLLILTISNHLIEIFDRSRDKPEFNDILKQIKKTENKNIVLFNPRETSVFIINYLENINPDIRKNFNFFEFKKLNEDLKVFWILCYMPEVNFECKINKINNFEIIDFKKTNLVHAYLYKKI